MACATISLKRSLEFDPLTHKRPKRRRCNPMALARLSNGATATTSSSPVATTTAALVKPPSAFQEATTPLNKEQLAASIRTEIKRLRRCKTKSSPASSHSQSDSSDGELPSSASPATSTCATQAHSSTELRKDNSPLFTFKQMTILCEKVVKERTDKLCEEYDQVLATKLAEQYESFLKFNHDQIQRHFTNSSDASYLS